MKEYLNEYELDELGECGMPCFLPSWSSDSWILGPESRAHVRVSDAASLPSTRNAAGHGRSENPSNSPRAAQKECCIYYVLPWRSCHWNRSFFVEIAILIKKKIVLFTKRVLYLGYVFPWQSVTPRCVGILGIRYLLRQESSTRER